VALGRDTASYIYDTSNKRSETEQYTVILSTTFNVTEEQAAMDDNEIEQSVMQAFLNSDDIADYLYTTNASINSWSVTVTRLDINTTSSLPPSSSDVSSSSFEDISPE